LDENGAKCLAEGIAKCFTLIFLNLELKNNTIGDNGA